MRLFLHSKSPNLPRTSPKPHGILPFQVHAYAPDASLTPTKNRIPSFNNLKPKISLPQKRGPYFSTITFFFRPSSSCAAANPRSPSSSSSSSRPPASETEYPLLRPVVRSGLEGPS